MSPPDDVTNDNDEDDGTKDTPVELLSDDAVPIDEKDAAIAALDLPPHWKLGTLKQFTLTGMYDKKVVKASKLTHERMWKMISCTRTETPSLRGFPVRISALSG